ncbi:hypothetical protein PaVLD_ORF067R [Planktothrix phage PaV-LD]|nr:hypothetical protein PaVLD_ORF067R [Planktothrix phage PaV-LD]ADZ31574.1 hypothetical protein PaVLD_ORF067R [Planktothrix phage PaV-LD]
MATESNKKQAQKSTPDPKSETKKEPTKEQKERAARFVANGPEDW